MRFLLSPTLRIVTVVVPAPESLPADAARISRSACRGVMLVSMPFARSMSAAALAAAVGMSPTAAGAAGTRSVLA
jgi:hypothetical protein